MIVILGNDGRQPLTAFNELSLTMTIKPSRVLAMVILYLLGRFLHTRPESSRVAKINSRLDPTASTRPAIWLDGKKMFRCQS